MSAVESRVVSRYLTFWVDSQLYALPATAVFEVIRLAAMARVPQGPRALLGLANLRGSVVPVVGLRELLGKAPNSALTEKLALILEQSTSIALVVDSIDTIETITADGLESSPQAWDAQGGEKLLGAFKIERTQQVAKLLDIDALLELGFAQGVHARAREREHRPITRSAAQPLREAHSELLVTFEVVGQEFALPLAVIDEVLPVPSSVTTIAHPDAVILGFTSVRDTLIPLLSLRALLGFDRQEAVGHHEKVIVLKVAGSLVGLVVDSARSVVSADLHAVEALPPILAARTGGESRIKAVYRGDQGRRLISILSPEQLFREDVMQRLAKIEPRANAKVPRPAGDSGEEQIFLVFRLGEDEFGLPIDTVVEVAPVPAQITRIPKTPKFLDGVVNIRGEVIPVVDQRRRFEMPALELQEGRRLVLIKTENHRAGIIVDSVSEVLRTTAHAISPYPDLTDHKSRLIRSVINLEHSNRLILLLDPTELLTRAEQSQLDSFQAQSKKARV